MKRATRARKCCRLTTQCLLHNARAALFAAALILHACAAHASGAQQSPVLVAPAPVRQPQPYADKTFCEGAPSEGHAIAAGKLFVACAARRLPTGVNVPAELRIVDPATGSYRTVARLQAISGINDMTSIGDSTLAVEGWGDGAALHEELLLVRTSDFSLIGEPLMDHKFLGTVGGKAYIDDACCWGRADQYRPATIYSISVPAGEPSKAVDLYPDRRAHEAEVQPPGQGAANYLIGKFLYVVVGDITYRYDVTDLHKPFVRMRTPKS